ncbi:MAG: MFS transporter, partial [Alphaproteobacteria bacterium]
IGVVAAVLAVFALFQADFWLFSVATLLTGVYQAFAAYYRFAAADVASESFKAKAISWVLAGGVAAAVVGPQLVIWTRSALAPVMFAGVFVSSAVLALIAFFLLSFVKIPLPKQTASTQPARPLGAIMRQPLFIVAVVCAMVSYAIMNLVMTATPLAMVGHGLTVDNAAFVIQWHVVAMFAPSFFTGSIINRFGAVKVILVGLVLLAVSGAISLSGTHLVNFGAALVMLGLGWNFAFVGATTLVTATYQPHERAKVQAANDFMVFGMVAFASLSSGILLQLFGWSMVNIALFPFVVVAAAMVIWLGRNQQHLQAQPGPNE